MPLYYSISRRVLIVIQFILFEMTDLFFDWEFYVEVSRNKRYEENVIPKIVLSFAIFGTIMFFIGLVFMITEVCKGRSYKADDIIVFFTTWTEDLPQMVLALYVAVDVGEPITDWVQYTKASLAIAESFFRCLIICILAKCPCFEEEDEHRWCPKFFDYANFFGYFVIMVCAVIIMLFLQL